MPSKSAPSHSFGQALIDELAWLLRPSFLLASCSCKPTRPRLDKGEEATTPDTVFWIASVTKPIAAEATLAEVDAGRLSLDVPMTADPRWHLHQRLQSGEI